MIATLRCTMIPCLLVAAFSTVASAQVLTGPVINPANGHRYYLLEQDNWTNSEALAQSLFNAHLVTINDAAENQWVQDTFGSFDQVQRNLWIGFNDVAVEGTFVWASGETPGYTNWRSGEPNDFETGEDFANIGAPSVNPTGLWNDLPDTLTAANALGGGQFPMHGVVEVVIPEPASALLLLIAATVGIGLRRSR